PTAKQAAPRTEAPPAVARVAPAEAPAAAGKKINGDGHHPVHAHANGERVATPALAQPEARAIPLSLAPPVATPGVAALTASPRREEVFLAGPAGEELRDYAYRYNSDGSV